MTIEHNRQDRRYLDVYLTRDEVSAIMAANLPMNTQLAQDGLVLLKKINSKITSLSATEVFIHEARVHLVENLNSDLHATTP